MKKKQVYFKRTKLKMGSIFQIYRKNNNSGQFDWNEELQHGSEHLVLQGKIVQC
jgi:hypothetical protein